MIIYSYPDLHDLRLVKFVNYISHFGWEPYVLSAKTTLNKEDRELLSSDVRFISFKDIFHKTKIKLPSTHSKAIKKSYQFIRFFSWFISACIGNLGIGWVPFNLTLAKKLIQEENIDLIFSSGLPPSCAVMGTLLKKITKKPLIIDFPDAWTLDPYRQYPTKLHVYIDRAIEKIVLNNCDYTTFATQGMADDYFKIYPSIREKSKVIRNGFDEQDLPKDGNKVLSKFTVTYTGRFYGLRSPDLFLNALHRILTENQGFKQEINVIFVGSRNESTVKAIDAKGLQDVIILTNQVPLQEAYKYMFSSSLLLLIEPTNALTTKAFEYLATGKPILAIIPESELAELIREYSDTSYIITTGNVDEIADAILDAYSKWKEGRLTLTSFEKVNRFREKYNRKNLTRELAKIFDEVIEKQKRKVED